jgi:DNA modification methylase
MSNKTKDQKPADKTEEPKIPVFCSYTKMVPVTEIIENPKNPNHHPDDQIALLGKIIGSQGWRSPIVVSTRSGFIVKGHGRYRSALTIGATEVPVDFQDYDSEGAEWADLIADNKIQELAELSKKELAELVEELYNLDFDLELTALSGEEINDLLNPEATPESDPNEEVQIKEPNIAQIGTVYELHNPATGRTHRLMCGDSTSQHDTQVLMGIQTAQIVFTDPPYGVSYESDSLGKLENDDKRGEDLVQTLLLPALKNAVDCSDDDAPFYIWHASSTRKEFDRAIDIAGLIEKQYIIWVKPSFVLGRSDYHWQTEPAYYCQKRGHRCKYIGNRKQSTVWKIQHIQPGTHKSLTDEPILIRDGEDSVLEIRHRKLKDTDPAPIKIPTKGTLLASTLDDQSDQWEIKTDNRNDYVHPTQKPIELSMKAMRNHITPGMNILDLFGGSGSTLFGAEVFGAIAFLMEYDPRFVDAICGRFINTFPGSKITANGKDMTSDFSQIAEKQKK